MERLFVLQKNTCANAMIRTMCNHSQTHILLNKNHYFSDIFIIKKSNPYVYVFFFTLYSSTIQSQLMMWFVVQTKQTIKCFDTYVV
jgi:threonine/homoserine/homoserine lactone efflux protein